MFIQVVITLINEPSKIDFTALLVLLGAAALAYFFALIAYRPFTGRGRKRDGGLLPPCAMMGFILAFGIIAVCITIYGLLNVQWRSVIGGASYLLVACGALMRYRKARSNDGTDA